MRSVCDSGNSCVVQHNGFYLVPSGLNSEDIWDRILHWYSCEILFHTCLLAVTTQLLLTVGKGVFKLAAELCPA